MRKKRVYPKRELKEDSLYHSFLVSKFINFVMKNGEKSISSRIVYDAMNQLSVDNKLNNSETVRMLENIIRKVSSDVEIRSMKFGGATYRVPVSSSEGRQISKSIRTIVKVARKYSRSNGIPMDKALHYEFCNINSNTGESLKYKEQILKTAAANKAFAHFFRRKRR